MPHPSNLFCEDGFFWAVVEAGPASVAVVGGKHRFRIHVDSVVETHILADAAFGTQGSIDTQDAASIQRLVICAVDVGRLNGCCLSLNGKKESLSLFPRFGCRIFDIIFSLQPWGTNGGFALGGVFAHHCLQLGNQGRGSFFVRS